MKILLVSLTRNYEIGLRVVHCCAAIGSEVHVASPERLSPYSISRNCRRVVRIPTQHNGTFSEAGIAKFAQHAATHGIDVVIPLEMEDAKFLDVARPYLGGTVLFPFSKPATLDRLNDKWRFAQIAHECGVSVPETTLISDAEQATEEALRVLAYPAIVKPLAEADARGVRRFENAAALSDYLSSGARYSALPLIVQRFIPGEDIDLNLVALDGRVLTQVTQCRASDRKISYSHDAEVESIGAKLVEAVAYTGIGHIDLRRDARTGRMVAIEFNPRFWLSVDCACWAGWNFVKVGIDVALQKPASEKEPPLPVTVLSSRGYLKHVFSHFGRTSSDVANGNHEGIKRMLGDLPAFAVARTHKAFGLSASRIR